MSLRRRDFLVAGVAGMAATASGCRACTAERREPAGATTREASGGWHELVWSAAEVPPEGQAALVLAGAEEPGAPLLVALHGRGEGGRGILAGARGWRDDYQVERMHDRLRSGSIDAADLGGFATEDRLRAIRGSLAAAPYRGVVLVTPYTPALRDRGPEGARDFARFVDTTLIARAASAVGRAGEGLRCGIDGVSMGGRLALWCAITHPARFASVGALQPAIEVGEADAIAGRLDDARAEGAFALRLVSSEADPFLGAVRALAGALEKRGVPHQLVVTPGPHDYAWNRGPGSAELLLHHERVLRALPPP